MTWEKKKKGAEEVKVKADDLPSCLCRLLSYYSLSHGQKLILAPSAIVVSLGQLPHKHTIHMFTAPSPQSL